MKHLSISSATLLALTLGSYAEETTPAKLQAKQSWFTTPTKSINADVLKKEISTGSIRSIRNSCLKAYKEASQKEKNLFQSPVLLKDNKLKGAMFKIDAKHNMPYANFYRGTRPSGGWPLVIAMHGGGRTTQKLANPHAWDVNSREWQAQVNLSASRYPNNCLYFVPRMVDDNNGRWWRDFNVTAYEKLIKHAILHWDINPNKVYMLGISEGGYGTEVLASWMPDKLAAANGMACGSSTSVYLENLRNLPFRTDVGEKDTAFGRVAKAKLRHVELDKLKAKDPKGYINSINVQAGRGHGIDYAHGPAWIMKHTRNPHPTKIIYSSCRNDGATRSSAYWLECKNELGKRYTFLKASSRNNSIQISAKATKADGKYQSPEWGQARVDQGEIVPASGLKLRIWLHEKQIDFNKPVKININGVKQTVAPKATVGALITSIKQFGDPNYAYAGYIDVVVK